MPIDLGTLTRAIHSKLPTDAEGASGPKAASEVLWPGTAVRETRSSYDIQAGACRKSWRGQGTSITLHDPDPLYEVVGLGVNHQDSAWSEALARISRYVEKSPSWSEQLGAVRQLVQLKRVELSRAPSQGEEAATAELDELPVLAAQIALCFAADFARPSVYSLNDGGTVFDGCNSSGRVVFVLRRAYLHVMSHIGGEFAEETLTGASFSAELALSTVRTYLASLKSDARTRKEKPAASRPG